MYRSHLLLGNTSSNSLRTNSVNNTASCPPPSVYPAQVPATTSPSVGGPTQQFNRTNDNVHLPPPQQSTYPQYNQKPYFASSVPPHQFGGRYEQTITYDTATTTNDRMGMIPSHGPSPVHRKLGPSPMTPATAAAAYPNNYQRQYSHLHQQSHLEHPSEMPNQKKLDPDQIPNPVIIIYRIVNFETVRVAYDKCLLRIPLSFGLLERMRYDVIGGLVVTFSRVNLRQNIIRPMK